MLPIFFLFHQAQISPFHPHQSNTQKTQACQVQTCNFKQLGHEHINPNIHTVHHLSIKRQQVKTYAHKTQTYGYDSNAAEILARKRE